MTAITRCFPRNYGEIRKMRFILVTDLWPFYLSIRRIDSAGDKEYAIWSYKTHYKLIKPSGLRTNHILNKLTFLDVSSEIMTIIWKFVMIMTNFRGSSVSTGNSSHAYLTAPVTQYYVLYSSIAWCSDYSVNNLVIYKRRVPWPIAH